MSQPTMRYKTQQYMCRHSRNILWPSINKARRIAQWTWVQCVAFALLTATPNKYHTQLVWAAALFLFKLV